MAGKGFGHGTWDLGRVESVPAGSQFWSGAAMFLVAVREFRAIARSDPVISSSQLRFIAGSNLHQSQDLSPVRPYQARGKLRTQGSLTTTAHVEPMDLLGGTMGHNGCLPDLSNTLRTVSCVM